MTRPVSTTAAALALLAAAALGGCSGTPASSPGSAPASSAGTAPSTSPVAASPSASPSSDPAAQTAAVKAATEKFEAAAFRVGYPDKTIGAYTARVKPLMTAHGVTELRSVYAGRNVDKILKTYYANRQRVNAKLLTPVKVTAISADKATATFGFRLVTEQKRGSGWKTVKSGEKDSGTVRLVQQGGRWLVDATE